MSAPSDDDPATEDERPKRPEPEKAERRPKRPAPSEMFPAEEEEQPPDVFDADVRRSHREHKQQVEAFARLAKDLIALAPAELAGLDLDPALEGAIAGCRALRKGARIREQRRIATLLRGTDARALRDRLDEIARGDRAKVDREKQFEQWRERLLEGGDAELSAFIRTHPAADRQLLRQLVRTAGQDRAKGKAVAAYRKLLREIRALADVE